MNGSVLSLFQFRIGIRGDSVIPSLRRIDDSCEPKRLTKALGAQAAIRAVRAGIVWIFIPKLNGGFMLTDWKKLWEEDLVTIEKRRSGTWEELNESDWEQLGKI